MTRVILVMSAAALLVVAGGWWFLRGRLPGPSAADATAAPVAERAEVVRRIRATLFYVSEDGLELVPVEREVPYAAAPADQAQLIIEAQLAAPPEPLRQALPDGTAVRHVFVTSNGGAVVDLGSEIAKAHGGGSLEELLTVYAIVNAVTANLPAITTVQILVDGREADTLAGHVDLRRGLRQNLSFVRQPAPPS